MSTRSTTHFCENERTEAIVYRHYDGYPSGAGTDILRFLRAVKQETNGDRLNDATALAATYAAWLCARVTASLRQRVPNASPLMNEGVVRILLQDPGDIAYRYRIRCDRIGPDGLPEVECRSVICSHSEDQLSEGVPLPIPPPED